MRQQEQLRNKSVSRFSRFVVLALVQPLNRNIFVKTKELDCKLAGGRVMGTKQLGEGLCHHFRSRELPLHFLPTVWAPSALNAGHERPCDELNMLFSAGRTHERRDFYPRRFSFRKVPS
jgi:hypothetical protein